MVEIFQIPNAGHVILQKVDRQGALQRKIEQVIVEQHRHIAAGGGGADRLVRGTAAMHHEPAVRAGAVQYAVIDELAGLVQETGVGGAAWRDFRNIAGGQVIQNRRSVWTDQMKFLQAGDIHQPGFGADGDMVR